MSSVILKFSLIILRRIKYVRNIPKITRRTSLKNADVARATGISNMTLSDWKNGKSKPKMDKLKLIADFFNVPIDYILTGDEALRKRYHIEIIRPDNEAFNARMLAYMNKLLKLDKEHMEKVLSDIDYWYNTDQKKVI